MSNQHETFEKITKPAELEEPALIELHVDASTSSLPLDEYEKTVRAAHDAYRVRTTEPFSFLDSLRASRMLAQLPEDDTILERIRALETQYFSPTGDPEGYVNGSALVDDETLYIPPTSRLTLLTAEHATAQMREGKRKEQDDFVGAIALLAAQDFGSGALVALGRQTGDPNWDIEHTFKRQMAEHIRLMECGHVAVHGCVRVTDDLLAERSLDFQLGIGSNPTNTTLEGAQRILDIANSIGLRGVVNTRFWNITSSPYPRLHRGEDGSPKTTMFAGGLPRTTRSFAERAMEDYGIDQPAIQLEIASTLRPQLPSAKLQKSRNQAATAANLLHEFMGGVTAITSSGKK